MYKLSARSKSRLSGVDQKLVNLMLCAISYSPYDFGISEGLRTIEQQKEYVRLGKSQTMKSYHLRGKAVDIFVYDENGKVTWNNRYYKEVADHILSIARKQGIRVTWGGSWKTLVDSPHFQLEE